jgi:transposase-like protein
LRRHFLEKVPISTLCDELAITPTLFYSWQKTFFENGAAAFAHTDRQHQAQLDAKDRTIAELQAKLQAKHEVLSEVMEEYVRLKKAPGGP